ncbi:hypothetical protein [Klebsiella pneumoniae]|uniref:hypothetical protein n=1 Tax=Klebsiella pneumoniae TaxID=573 RepID=UPI003A80FF41
MIATVIAKGVAKRNEKRGRRQGRGIVEATRLYQLIRQPAPSDDRLFEIEFLDGGAAAFCFTFG